MTLSALLLSTLAFDAAPVQALIRQNFKALVNRNH